MTVLLKKLKDYVLSGTPAIYLQSGENNRVDKLLSELAKSLCYNTLEWNQAYGIVDFITKRPLQETPNPLIGDFLLNQQFEELNKKILIIKQADFIFTQNQGNTDIVAISRLYDLLNKIQRYKSKAVVVLVGKTVEIPNIIEEQVKLLELLPPTLTERQTFIKMFYKERNQVVESQTFNNIVNTCSGLTEQEIKQVLSMSLLHDNDIENTYTFINNDKQQIIAKSGVLEMVKVTEDFNDIGGLKNIRSWLERKGEIIQRLPQAKRFGVQPPKGVLIAGMPGCGKSLTAKATASLFKLPLLRLDMGALLGKYVGDSESNMRKALSMSESISPCVLWVDELEKAFDNSGGNSGSEITARLLGTFLTWLQEKSKPVFVVATANNISKLPPELLRKGRFDEVFYVGFPSAIEREDILEIHLMSAKQELRFFDIPELSKLCRDYSGSDIQNAINEALEIAFCDKKPRLTQQYLVEAIKNTVPLRETIKDQINEYEEKFERFKLKPASESQGLSVSKMLEMAKDPNMVQRKKVAEDSECSEDILEKLALDGEKEVRLAAIKNNNCKTQTITSIINIDEENSLYDKEIFELAILHSNAPTDLLAKLITDNKLAKSLETQLIDKLLCIKTSSEELQLMMLERNQGSENESIKTRKQLAGFKDLTENIQLKLANDKNDNVRERLAGNPTLNEDVIHILLKDRNEKIVKTLKYHLNKNKH